MSSGLFQKTQSLCFSSQSNKTISVYMNGNDAHLVLFSLQNTFKEIVIFFLTNSGSSEKRQRRQWHPTLVLLPGESHGRRSLVGCSPWGPEELNTTEHLHFHFHALEKEMATHPSVLAWRIPGTGEPRGLPSMGSHRVRHASAICEP